MNMRKTFRSALLLTTVLSLAACSSATEAKKTTKDIQDASVTADKAMDSFRSQPAKRAGGAQVSQGVFVAPIKERGNAAALLPSRVERPSAVVMNTANPLTLQEIADRLTKVTRIEHVLALGSPDGAPSDDLLAKTVRAAYSGKLSDVLTEVSNSFGVEWSYQDGKVVFRDYITRQYQIPVIPSVAAGSSDVGGATSGYTADFWAEFEAAIDGIIEDGVIYSVSRSTGILTATARFNDHAEIKGYIDEVSKNMTQQIAFDVNVVSIVLDSENGAGLDLDLALESVLATNQEGAATEFRRGGANVVGALAESGGGMNISILEGDVDFNAMVSALSKQGDTSIDTRTGVTTINNRPVPVEVVDSISYIASISSETDVNGNIRLIPQPETQDVGFNLQIYPRIMNSSEIMVEYSLSLSELKGLRTFGTGENAVQLPEISNTSFSQQSVLQNGQTLILSGFERNRKSSDVSKSGGLLSIGGSTVASEEKVATVVMIRPRILKSSKDIRSGSN